METIKVAWACPLIINPDWVMRNLLGIQNKSGQISKDVSNTGNGERGTGNGERGTGNGERGTGNGERGTGNGEPGTGVWERVYSGNSFENSKWRTKQKKRPQESTEETI